MITDEMVEAAARAVDDELNHVSCGDYRLHEDGYKMIARAALEAALAVIETPREMTGFVATLTENQKQAALDYRGCDTFPTPPEGE